MFRGRSAGSSVSGKVHVLSEARKLGKPTGKIATQVFTPHHVFGPNETDDAVYNTSVSPLVAHALAGGASTVIAYGATGAGKTHSMTAVQRLAAAALLAGGQHKLRLSFFELRGEGCYDLLHEQRELVLRDDGTGDIVVCGRQLLTHFASPGILGAGASAVGGRRGGGSAIG